MTDSANSLIALTNKDARFYKLIGPFLGRREVHRAVGSAVWDDDDKTWLVITTAMSCLRASLVKRPICLPSSRLIWDISPSLTR